MTLTDSADDKSAPRSIGRNGKPLRVLMVSDPYPPEITGGAEIYAHHVAKALASLGHEVEALTSRRRSGPASYEYEGIPVRTISTASIPAYDPRVAFASLEGEWDVVHLHNFRRLTGAIMEALSQRARHITWTIHDYYPVCHRINMIRVGGEICREPANSHCFSCRMAPGRGVPVPGMFHRWALHATVFPRVGSYIAPSHAMKKALVTYGLPAPKLRVVHNGVPRTPFREIHSDHRILFVGRLEAKHKGLSVLLDALSMTPRDVTLEIAGMGDKSQIADACAARGLEGRVHLSGRLPTLDDAYARSAAVVVPSLWEENCSLVIQEALMAGRPVIATRVGGNPELIQDGVTGLLVPPGDAVGLGAAIRTLTSRPQLLRSMSTQARKHALQHFDLQRHVEEIESFYFQSLAGG